MIVLSIIRFVPIIPIALTATTIRRSFSNCFNMQIYEIFRTYARLFVKQSKIKVFRVFKVLRILKS